MPLPLISGKQSIFGGNLGNGWICERDRSSGRSFGRWKSIFLLEESNPESVFMKFLFPFLRAFCGVSLCAALILFLFPSDAGAEVVLPDPDGKPADVNKPVKVFLIMGQSNTLEMGRVKGNNCLLYTSDAADE